MKRLLLVALWSLIASPAAAQTTLTVTGKGSTFVLKFPANGGYTQDRGDTLEDAAEFWADRLESAVDIEVAVSFTSLGCTSNSAVLGAAGARSVHQNFTNAPRTNTLYSAALANSIAGSDLNTSAQSSFPEDLVASFNSDLDDPNQPNCLGGADWHYGTSAATAPDIPFYQVALHELAHGLGFQTFANFATGQLAGFTGNPSLFGTNDQYVIFLRDAANNRDLDDASATDAQRQTAGTNGDLVWTGSGVNDAATGLTSGLNQSRVEMYAPSSFASGSSISHFDIGLSPDQLMEPSRTPTFDTDLTAELLYEIGWVEANETPLITGQDPLSVDEDSSLGIALADLSVTDPDNVYPADFSLSLETGANYTVSGSTVTPDADFDGTLTVPVIVNDGIQDSAPFDLTITVNPINDAPVLTGQQPLRTDEDVALELTAADLVIEDPDDTSFSLSLQPGMNYSVAGTTVTPAANFNGTLTVPVTVDDGDLTSNGLDVMIEVAPVNDAPVISGQRTLTVPEDTGFTYAIGDMVFTDADDSSGFTIRVLPGTGYALSGNTVSPDANFFGNLTVPVVVSDGTDDSAPFDTILTVTPVNDPPTIVQQADLRTDEDTPITVRVSDFTVVDPDDSSFSLRLTMLANGSEMSGVVTPDPDFVGVVTAIATVDDGALTSAPFAVSITVDPVNDAPVITAAAGLQTDEDVPLTIEATDLSIDDPDDSSFTVQVLPGTNYTAAGATLTADPDFSGSLQVSLRVNDGEVDGPDFMATVVVNPVNDPPVVSGQSPVNLPEDGRRVISLDDLQVEDVDDDPSALSVILLPGPNYDFSGPELIPDPDFAGTLEVGLQVSDGDDLSEPFTLNVTVDGVDDAPVIEGQSMLTATEDQPFELSLDDVNFDDADGEGDFVLLVDPGADYEAQGTTVTPAPDFFGSLEVQVRVDDGTLQSAPFALRVEVEPVNDPPVILGQETVSTFLDTPIELEPADLRVEDVDDRVPEDIILRLEPGTNGTVTGLTFTPAAGFTGLAEVTALVSDGEADSAPFVVTIGVAEPALEGRIEIDAVGLFTPRPDVEPPEALGLVPQGQVELAEAPTLLRPGRSAIIWREFNDAGEEAFFEQEIWVQPLIGFAEAPLVQGGERARFEVWPNGFFPESFRLDFTIDDPGGVADQDDGAFLFDRNDLGGALDVLTVAPDGPQPLALRTAFGSIETTVLAGANTPPRIELEVSQDGRPGLVLAADGGPVRFSARAVDAESPGLALRWTFPPTAVVTEDGEDRLVDASTLESGLRIAVRVTDAAGATTVRRVALRVLATIQAPDPSDRDGDGIAEESEAQDADLDGLGDALDAWALPHVQPMGLAAPNGELSPDVVEAEPGVKLLLGALAQRVGGLGVGVTAQQLEAEGASDPRPSVDAYVDMIVTDLARTGQTVDLVIPLRGPVPDEPTVLRVFQSSAWFDFAGEIATAPGGASCPPPDVEAFRPGLTAGDRCLRLRIQDGGTDDGDGAANREILLLAGLAEAAPPTGDVPGDDPAPAVSSVEGECNCRETGRASGAPWLLFALVLPAMWARRRLRSALTRARISGDRGRR